MTVPAATSHPLSALPSHAAAPPPRPGLWARGREALARWRDRRLADPDFRRWAVRFPLTRPIARRRAAALFDLVAGFSYTQVLLACVELRVFDRLAARPAGLDELATAFDLPPDACRRLLDAAVALRLLRHAGTPAGASPRYGLGSLGAAMAGNPALAAMVSHHRLLYDDLAEPLARLRGGPGGGRLAAFWAYARSDDSAALHPDQVTAYTALMAASQTLVADEVLGSLPLLRCRHLMDVGGGDGSFAAAAAQRWPHLEVTVFDLPAVAARAHTRLCALGLADRARAVGGDFGTDALPEGADIVSLVRVVHDHDDDVVLRLLTEVRRVLAPGGALLIAEPMAATPGARAMGDAYFGLYLWAMGSGRPRSADELGRLLRLAGFAPPRRLHNPMPLQTQLLLTHVT